MFDKDKLDSYFSSGGKTLGKPKEKKVVNHTTWVNRAKIVFPSFAALLLGILLLYPSIEDAGKEIKLNIIRPNKGELEKLNIEKTVFYITDAKNLVHNFTSISINETEAGSKVIKLNSPEGIIQREDGSWFNIKSPTGFYNQKANSVELTEDVEIFYSEGMTLNAIDMTYDFANSLGFSKNPVKARGHMGDLDSQSFNINNNTGVLTFIGKTHINLKEEALKRN